MKTTLLSSIIDRYDTFLLDASGVIYSDYGPFKGTVDTIQQMQKKGHVFVVTNNSFQYMDTISEKLKNSNIHIPAENVISSGQGLSLDPEIKALIHNKCVYIYGSDNSKHYIWDAGAKELTDDITQADVIVMTASYKSDNDTHVAALKSEKQQRPHLPIICCNPDKVVLSKRGIKPVVGHYAKVIEELTSSDVHWIGKPLQNFSTVVKHLLDKHHPHFYPERTCFFDDNIENVMRLKRDLNISGCWVKDTGIFKEDSAPELIQKYGKPDYLIPVLSA